MSKRDRKTKAPRGIEDVRAALREQVEMLKMTCEVYDGGKRSAAKYMATTIRLLLHQTQNSHALLQQLGLRAGRFSEWADGRPPSNAARRAMRDDWSVQIGGPLDGSNSPLAGTISMAVTSSCRLVVQYSGPSGGECVAPLSSFGTEIKRRFDNWWNSEVVRDGHGHTFCRRELVLEVANTDGGAHVDPGLEQKYLEFSRKNSLAWNFSVNGKDWEALPTPHLACIRQIAHEVLVTLQRTAPWAFGTPYSYRDPLEGKDGWVIGGLQFEEARK